jgi:hypothetical protein
LINEELDAGSGGTPEVKNGQKQYVNLYAYNTRSREDWQQAKIRLLMANPEGEG